MSGQGVLNMEADKAGAKADSKTTHTQMRYLFPVPEQHEKSLPKGYLFPIPEQREKSPSTRYLPVPEQHEKSLPTRTGRVTKQGQKPAVATKKEEKEKLTPAQAAEIRQEKARLRKKKSKYARNLKLEGRISIKERAKARALEKKADKLEKSGYPDSWYNGVQLHPKYEAMVERVDDLRGQAEDHWIMMDEADRASDKWTDKAKAYRWYDIL